jgi:hypothetical protein
MPPPRNAAATGGRLSGGDMCEYFESFHRKFLKNRPGIRTLLGRRVLSIRRSTSKEQGWDVKVISGNQEGRHAEQETMWFKRIVVCTGVRFESSDILSSLTNASILRVVLPPLHREHCHPLLHAKRASLASSSTVPNGGPMCKG